MMKAMTFLAVFGLMFMMVYAGDEENVVLNDGVEHPLAYEREEKIARRGDEVAEEDPCSGQCVDEEGKKGYCGGLDCRDGWMPSYSQDCEFLNGKGEVCYCCVPSK